MRTTPLGIVMLNDEREHVYTKNNPLNMRVVRSWAKLIEGKCTNGSYLASRSCKIFL